MSETEIIDKVLKELKKNPIYLLLILLGILLSYFIIIKLFSKDLNIENFISTSNNKKKCVYYYWKKCGHCKTFSPVWDEVKNEINTNNNYTNIKNNCELIKKEKDDFGASGEIEKFNIEGFPCVLILNSDSSNKLHEYQGDRSKDNLLQWLQGNI
tara:strand:+ start:47 stop:511 length:465 start_codon:yes stop_codon:yes gene_type:complete